MKIKTIPAVCLCFVVLFILIRTDGLPRTDLSHQYDRKAPLFCRHQSLMPLSFPRHQRTETDRVIVRFRPSVSQIRIDSDLTNFEVRKFRRIPELLIYSLQVPDGITAGEMVSVLQLDPDVEFCEPDYWTFLCDYPNDTYFPLQYGLLNTGQSIGLELEITGSSGADIKAVEAWDEVKGKASRDSGRIRTADKRPNGLRLPSTPFPFKSPMPSPCPVQVILSGDVHTEGWDLALTPRLRAANILK